MTGSGLSAELLALRMRMKAFIDGDVIPAEPVLGEGTQQSAARITELKAEAKRRGLWARAGAGSRRRPQRHGSRFSSPSFRR